MMDTEEAKTNLLHALVDYLGGNVFVPMAWLENLETREVVIQSNKEGVHIYTRTAPNAN